MKSIRTIRRPKINHRKILVFIILMITVIVMIPVSVSLVGEIKKNTPVAKVNGEPISIDEFKHALTENVVNTFNYFKQKHGVDDNAKFWTSSYDGEVPVDYAREITLKSLERTKIVQILAKQKGIIKDINYSSYLKDLKNENKRREDDVSNGRVIYGPVQYGEREYFNYVFNNMIIQLKEKLGEDELHVEDSTLKELYESDKDKMYKNQDSVKVEKIYVSLVDEKGNVNNDKKQEAETIIREIKLRLGKGEKMEEALRAYKNTGLLKVRLEEQTLDESTARSDFEAYPKLMEEAVTLDVGETSDISDIIEENNSFTIIKCIDKKDQGYKSFDEVKELVRSRYIDDKFEEMVDSMLEEAKVDVNWKTYKSVFVR